MQTDNPTVDKPQKKRKKVVLTEKQSKLAHLIVEKPNTPLKTNALAAGYSEAIATSDVYAMVAGPKMQEAIEDIRQKNQRVFDRLGMGHDTRIAKVISLTGAKKTIAAFDDLHEVDDASTQLAATKEALKLCGDYPDERMQVEHKGGVVFKVLMDPLADALDITPED